MEHILINSGGAAAASDQPVTLLDALKKAYPEDFGAYLCAKQGGAILPLNARIASDADLCPLTFQDGEARRVYERTLRFVFLLAVDKLCPGAKVRVENSMGRGVFCRLPGIPIDREKAGRIKDAMRDIVGADLPLVKERYKKEDAIAYFQDAGRPDIVELLKYRPFAHFWLYELGGLKDYFYGEMLPSTGYVGVFDVLKHGTGLILMMPDPKDPSKPARFADSPKLDAALSTTAAWAGILECKNAADLNGMIQSNSLREFIRINEALHEKSIADIAGRIREKKARLVLIAGPSSSGKTTFTHRLAVQLRALGLKYAAISLDDYYIDRDKLPREPDGSMDFEKLEALDVPLFNEHLNALLSGGEVSLPTFDFHTGKSVYRGRRLKVAPDQIILVEGIHGLNPGLTGGIDDGLKFKIYVSALTQLNLDDHNRIRTTDARLLRRMVRDMKFRNSPIERTFGMWESVRRGEEKYIFPYQEMADVMFDTSLQYELAILKKHICPALSEVDPLSPHYVLARRLMKFLNYFLCADEEDEIPGNSILREFIGGSCFYREEGES